MYRSFLDTKISSDFWDALISGFGTNWNDNDTNEEVSSGLAG